ncbi:MAG: type III pantothenate kinase [Legionellales bacterium]|nr:type III pantothenate kinase [Legionellales bacterium]
MILCLDVGNSHIYGGVFSDEQILLRFRLSTKASTSDELGIFLTSVLRENSVDVQQIHQIALCSVVPNLDYSLRSACVKYFKKEPFVLQAGVKTGLKIQYRNPLEVGADRIANAIGASVQFPDKNLIIIDFGTATTFCAVSRTKQYLGGVIIPGIQLSMEALQSRTAKLPPVEIIRPKQALGRSTVESIQAGLYHATLAATQAITQRLCQSAFTNESVLIIATGGFAHLFEPEKIFDMIIPDLVLQGLKQALENNL